MSHRYPRLALASPASGPEFDPSAVCLATLAGLTDLGWRVQHFRTRACLCGTQISEQITGLPTRHLDPWLMPEDVRREVFLQGSRNADLVLVEGLLDPPAARGDYSSLNQAHHASYQSIEAMRPGELGPVAETLDLPKVAIVPCERLENFHIKRVGDPDEIDAAILDGIIDPHEFERLSTLVSAILDCPVIGAIEALPEARRALKHAGRSGRLSREVLGSLGESFLKFADLPKIMSLADRSPLPEREFSDWDNLTSETELCARPGFRVAYAHDEAFRGYYPETLDALESAGAVLAEFSPLHDERLPEEADLVLIGCGRPERHAQALAMNWSMASALRSFASQGGRIYAEGGGAAYLSRQMRIHGKTYSGVGIFDAEANLRPQGSTSTPVDRAFMRSSWLGRSGTQLRGYLNRRWRFAAPTQCQENSSNVRSGSLTAQHDMVFRHRAIGSLVHLHPAALPCLMAAFVLLTGDRT